MESFKLETKDERAKRQKTSMWSWKISDEDLKNQVDNYDSLKVIHSYRGIATLLIGFIIILSLSAVILLGFDSVYSSSSAYGVYFELILYVILGFFVYRGRNRWAIIAVMILWSADKGFQIYQGIQGGNSVIWPIIWWFIFMPYFWKALRVENAIKSNKVDIKNTQPNKIFCHTCGSTIETDAKFCTKCGNKVLNKIDLPNADPQKIKNEPIVSINVSRNQTLIFYNDFFTYKGLNIAYKNIDGISYLWTKTTQRVYFVPVSTTNRYAINIESAGVVHNINFSSGFLPDKQEEKEREYLFRKFVSVLDGIIKPFVVTNLLINYSKRGALKLGESLTITPNGIYKKRIWRQPELLAWNQYYNSNLSKGNLFVYQQDPSKNYKVYFSCPMSVINAVVMPDILNFLFQKNGVLDPLTVQELNKRKSNASQNDEKTSVETTHKKGFCWSCSASIEEGQKFCIHCGSKLM